jgi:hypothetical protein
LTNPPTLLASSSTPTTPSSTTSSLPVTSISQDYGSGSNDRRAMIWEATARRLQSTPRSTLFHVSNFEVFDAPEE